jgi:drug/metabolite transporter (DMT)-like permease
LSLPIHELAALGTATCWAVSALFSADAVRALGPFHFNLLRQVFVTVLLAGAVMLLGGAVWPDGPVLLRLALSGFAGILLGDTFNFAAVGRLGPRRAGAVFALNAPMAAGLAWILLDETLSLQAVLGIVITVSGVALAILGRPAAEAHRFEQIRGTLLIGLGFGLLAGLGQATGSLLARPILAGGMDPYFASLIRVGTSALAMAAMGLTPLAPPRPAWPSAHVLALTAAVAVIGLFSGMTLFLFALSGGKTGIIATLSATSPVIILPLLWARTGQRPRPLAWAGAILAVLGLALIFLR